MKAGWRSFADVIGGSARLTRGVVPLRRATPRRLVRIARDVSTHGLTLAGLARVASIRNGGDVVLVDDDGTVTADQLDRWSATVAGELINREIVASGGRLGVLCRSGRGFAVATIAALRLGADAVILPFGLGASALAELLRVEDLRAVVHDEEFADDLAAARYRGVSVLADSRAPGVASLRSMQALPQAPVPTPSRRGGVVVVTIGPDGRAQRARRRGATATSGIPLTTLVRQLDVARGSPILITPPLHQPVALQFFGLALGLGCPAVVMRRFDAARARDLIDRHHVGTVVTDSSTLPALVEASAGRPAPSSVRAIVTGGAPLPATDWQTAVEVFGPVVHHVYGNAHVGWCTLATPDDLAAAPGTVGRPAAGIELRVVDDDGVQVPVGVIGRLLVRSPLAAADAASDDDGLVDTGDRGRLDEEGRVFVVTPTEERRPVAP